MKSTDRTPANSVSQTSLCCRYSPGSVRTGRLVFVGLRVYTCGCVDYLSLCLCHCPCAVLVFIVTHLLACCVRSPSDVISPRVQDPPAEPPLQVFSAGEDGGVEGSVRLPLQGFVGAEDKQEAS